MVPELLQPTRRNRYIYDTLVAAIAKGQVPAGLVLTQSSVSRHFGVSRAPAADALERMAAGGHVVRFDGRGYMIGTADQKPLRIELSEVGLNTGAGQESPLGGRNWRDTLYPAVEAEVAGCISYGAFILGSAALARHYGFSRTTSHEMLSRLERVGLIEQASNGRWHAPAMTAADVRDHYQIRQYLEPVALLDAASAPDGPRLIQNALTRIEGFRSSASHLTRDDITTLESDLHKDLVLSCRNLRIRDTLNRSQLPLIATHTAFDRYTKTDEMRRVLNDHAAILQPLSAGDHAAAASAMVAHLEQGMRSTITYIENRPTPPAGLIPPYMTLVV